MWWILLIVITTKSTLLPLDERADLIQAIKNTDLAVFFYGTQTSEQYSAYEMTIPSDKELFSGLQFYFIPSDQIALKKTTQTLFIYRNIPGNEWLYYSGPYSPVLMAEWIRHHSFDPLPELTGQNIDTLMIQKKKGFMLLDYGHFSLLGTKILVRDYCLEKGFICGKCTFFNKILGKVAQLMQSENQPGIDKLGFWDPNTQKVQIFTRAPLSLITRDDLDEIVEGRQGLVKPEMTVNPNPITEDL